MQRIQSFVAKRTRNSGLYTPGFMRQFEINHQVLIIKKFKAKGGCLRTGLFVVSEEIEEFLKKEYSISKKWNKSHVLLEDLGINVKVFQPESPNSSIRVTEFECKMGNAKTPKYHVKVSV